MSNLKKESSTPIKSSSNLYDNHQTNAKLINDSNSTHTPCTRLSRVAIDSQSNPPCKRIRTTHSQRPAMNFNDKLIQALGEEGISNPNLSMAFGGNRIRMTNKGNQNNYCFSEDKYSSDEDDLFSSSSYLIPSLYCIKTVNSKQNIFDEDNSSDEENPSLLSSSLFPVSSPDSNKTANSKRDLFNENNEEGDAKQNRPDMDNENRKAEITDKSKVYDHTTSWLSCIYHDSLSNISNSRNRDYNQHIDEEKADEENRPPKRKVALSNSKSRKMRIMGTLLPRIPAFKRKGNL